MASVDIDCSILQYGRGPAGYFRTYNTSAGETECLGRESTRQLPLNQTNPPPQASIRKSNVFRTLGLGLITGAADDDCSAIGTYASAGAKFGPSFLWTAPVTFPMMFAVVYLSAKVGQVSGRGLFAVIRDHYSP